MSQVFQADTAQIGGPGLHNSDDAETSVGSATRAECLFYLVTLTGEMSVLASRAGFARLATILALAKDEADQQLRLQVSGPAVAAPGVERVRPAS